VADRAAAATGAGLEPPVAVAVVRAATAVVVIELAFVLDDPAVATTATPSHAPLCPAGGEDGGDRRMMDRAAAISGWTTG
jgi:uncharacterized protein (DUF1778 family)